MSEMTQNDAARQQQHPIAAALAIQICAGESAVTVGPAVGACVGVMVGAAVGAIDGELLGFAVGAIDGACVGAIVGE